MDRSPSRGSGHAAHRSVPTSRVVAGPYGGKSGTSYPRNYYRSVYYYRGDHPRVRIRKADLDAQVLAIFGKMRIDEQAYAAKRTQLRDRLASIKLQRDALG